MYAASHFISLYIAKLQDGTLQELQNKVSLEGVFYSKILSCNPSSYSGKFLMSFSRVHNIGSIHSLHPVYAPIGLYAC